MKIRQIENVSNKDLMIKLTDGNYVGLKPTENLKNVDVDDISEVRGFTKIIQELNEPKKATGLIQLRD